MWTVQHLAGQASRDSGSPAVGYSKLGLDSVVRYSSCLVQKVGLRGILGFQLLGIAGQVSRDAGSPALGYSTSGLE